MAEQQSIEQNNQADEKQTNTPEDIKIKLEGLGFEETKTKQDLWKKQINDDTIFWWDFRKSNKGHAWCNRGNSNVPDEEMALMTEYMVIRGQPKKQPDKPKTDSKKTIEKPKIVPTRQTIEILEDKGDAHTLMNIKDDEQVIAEIQGRYLSEFVYNFKTKQGEVTGLSWAGTKEIARMQGNISIDDINISETEKTYRVLAQARDTARNVTMFGVAEQSKMLKLKTGMGVEDLHALSKCVSRSQRNAIRGLIPEMFIKEMITQFSKGKK